MLKSLLLSAAVTASLATGAFAQSTSTAPASPMAPMTTTPATPTVGTRNVAVAWNDVKVDTNADVAFVNLSKEQLNIAPEFKDRRTKP